MSAALSLGQHPKVCGNENESPLNYFRALMLDSCARRVNFSFAGGHLTFIFFSRNQDKREAMKLDCFKETFRKLRPDRLPCRGYRKVFPFIKSVLSLAASDVFR